MKKILFSVAALFTAGIALASDQAESIDGSNAPAAVANEFLLADNRRKERRDDRGDDRDGRQDCRQDEGRVGDDKRECKQDEREDDRDGDDEPETDQNA